VEKEDRLKKKVKTKTKQKKAKAKKYIHFYYPNFCLWWRGVGFLRIQ
jgi:hypothetical protein